MSRVTAKQRAADEARTQFAQDIGHALGIIPDGQEADPAQLTAQLTASQAQARQTAVELAVHRTAPDVGADAEALLDSRAFTTSLADIDPIDAIQAATTAAITANPKRHRNEPVEVRHIAPLLHMRRRLVKVASGALSGVRHRVRQGALYESPALGRCRAGKPPSDLAQSLAPALAQDLASDFAGHLNVGCTTWGPGRVVGLGERPPLEPAAVRCGGGEEEWAGVRYG